MFRYVHTNIIAKDSAGLIDFYKSVFQCKSIGETRDLRGDWHDKMMYFSSIRKSTASREALSAKKRREYSNVSSNALSRTSGFGNAFQ